MKLLCQKLLLTAAALFSIQSLTAQDEVLRHIPAHTSQMVQVDLQRLQQFMKWEEILQLPVMEKISELKTNRESDKQFFEYLENPSATGVDLNSPLYIFSHRSLQDYSEAFKGVGGKIKNLQQFTAWILNINKTIALTKTGRVKTVVKNNMAFVWDTESFIVVHDDAMRYNFPVDTVALNKLKSMPKDSASEALASLMKFFEQPSAPPISDEVIKSFNEDAPMPAFDSRMLALFRQTEPLKAWNYNSVPGRLSALFNPMQALSRIKQEEEKTSIIASSSVLNFDNGRAFYLSRTYLDGQLDKFFSSPSKQAFDVSMIQNAGLQKLVGFLTLKINMPSLGTMLTENMPKEQLDELFNKMKKNGIEPTDLLAAFTGDIFIGCANPGGKNEDVPPALVAALKINNLAAAERILNKWKESNEESKKKNKEWFGMNEAKTMLIISTSQENAEAFLLKGTGVVNDKALEEEIKANPFYLQLNVNELYNIMMRLDQPKKEKEKLLADMFSDIQHFKITAGKYEQNALLLDYELAFNNKEDNGFRQMMLMYDKLLRSMLGRFEDVDIKMPEEKVIIDGEFRKDDIPPPPPQATPEEMNTMTIGRDEPVFTPPVIRARPKTKTRIVSKEEAEKIRKANNKKKKKS